MLLPDPIGLQAAMLLLVLAAALAFDAAVGEMPMLFRVVPHPIVALGRVIAGLERRLNREHRSERDRLARGIVVCIVVVGGAALAGVAVAALCRALRLGIALEAFVVAVLLAQRSLFDHVAAVARALDIRGLAAGRKAVAHIVGRDPASLDEHGVARAAIESLAENFSDGVVAPVLWYALLGLPGLFAYKAANTLDSMIGHRSPRYRSFGWASARLDDVLNIVPARLGALLLAAASAVVPRAKPVEALRTIWRDAGRHRSVNAGWPEAAMAGALGLALAGPRRYTGHVTDDPWIGAGRARAAPADIDRALALYLVACGLQGAGILIAGIALWATGGPAVPLLAT